MADKIFVAETTHIVMPGDTNHHGTLFGGRLMEWLDITAALAAQRCAGSVVTASVDALTFEKPVILGDVVTLRAAVNKVWNSSMEVGVRVSAQSYETKSSVSEPNLGYSILGNERDVCKAYLTFVAIDKRGLRRNICLENKDGPMAPGHWATRWAAAEKRRQQRLANK